MRDNPKCRKYNINHQYFNTIDTEEKAYWLGFIAADGNVKNQVLSLEISDSDIGHLYKFAKAIGSNYPIKKTRKSCCRIQISSFEIINDLLKYNITEKKSHIICSPSIPYKLLQHYYRGYFDGDGWITSRRSKSKGKFVTTNRRIWDLGYCSGSDKILIEIREWFSQKLNLPIAKIFTHKRSGSLYQFAIGGSNKFLLAGDALYNNSTIFLNRKKEKWISAIKNINETNASFSKFKNYSDFGLRFPAANSIIQDWIKLESN